MNLNINEKIYLKNNMELYFITGIIGLFMFFSFSYYAKYLDELVIYIISEVGMFISGILYISSFIKIYNLNKDIVKETKYLELMDILDKEKKKKNNNLLLLLVNVLLLFFSLLSTRYVINSNDNLFFSLIFVIITFICSYIIGKIFLVLQNSILVIKNVEKKYYKTNL